MKYLNKFNEARREKQLINAKDARKVLSTIYNIVDEYCYDPIPRENSLVDFLVDSDQFLDYAEKYDGFIAGNKFESPESFKYIINDYLSGISPVVCIAPFWFTRDPSTLTEFRDVYSDTIYVKIIEKITKKKINEIQDRLEADECHLVKAVSGDIYLRIWWD